MNNLTIPMTLSIDAPIPLTLQQQVIPRLSMTNELKTALLQIAEKVAYIDDQGQQYYQDLYDALYPPAATYTVTNTLTGCTSSNSAIAITEGESYSATITASSGYSLTGATVSITMGGTDITASAYTAGTISIASVTGDLSITVTAVAVMLSSISAVYTQSGTVYDTDSLDILRDDLVVTATYSDSSTQTVTNYTLSGTLTVGTSTITVSYGGKTTTFTVTVSEGTLYDLSGSDFTIIGLSNFTPYTTSNSKRLSYTAFDLALDGGKTYVFTLTADVDTAQISPSFYTQNTLDAVANNQNINTSYIYEPGWNDEVMVRHMTVPETVNNSPVRGCRITLRKDSNNSTISSNFITRLTIKEVTT